MKLKTSFFNVTVLRKNLTRFAPLWALTAIFEVLCLMTDVMLDPKDMAWSILIAMNAMAIPTMIYAACVAACVFGDLFNSRLCNGLHAMPLRREGWMLTNLASGFLFALIPSVVGGTVAAVIMKEYSWIALLWQGIILLQFVFFFGVAVFSAVCTGKRSGMMAIYVLINFLSVLIYWIAQLFYEHLLRGVVLSQVAFTRFSPLITMSGAEYVQYEYSKIPKISLDAINIQIQDWNYLFICAGVGIVFLALSWLLYRKRHLETAGDFISFRPIKIVFLLAYTFAVGAFFYSVFGAFDAEEGKYGYLVVGVLVGWFTGWMLLERTVKVFTKKVILGLVAFGLLFSGSMVLTASDFMKIAVYVPDAKDIESVCLYTDHDSYYYDYAWELGGWYRTEPEEIARVQQLHLQMIDTPDVQGAETISTSVRYQLKNGREIHRTYEIPVKSQTAEDLSCSLSDVRAVLNTNDNWETIRENIQSIKIRWNSDRPTTTISAAQKEQMEDILDAFEADYLAGNMAQHGGFQKYDVSIAGIEITWDDQEYGNRIEYVTIYASCDHLYVLLRQM